MTDIAETAGFISSESVAPSPSPAVEEQKSGHNVEENSEPSRPDEPIAPVASRSETDAKDDRDHTGRKQVILAIHWAVIFTCVLVYFVYLMDYYLDEDRNVKKYAVSKHIKKMPIPFIYIEFQSNDGNCWPSGLYHNDSYNLYSLSDTSISTKTLVEEHAKSSWVQISKENDGIDGWMQLLFVPPKDKELMVESKNFIGVDVYCHNSDTTEVWLLIGHTGELMEHETVEQALDIFYYDSDRLFSGYEVRVTYEWYGYRNKLDDEAQESDYFASTIESTFAMNDPAVQSWIQVSPNPSGRKTVFVTIEEISFWSVLSLVGGMLSATSILTALTVYLIWGYSLHHRCPIPTKCQTFEGLAPAAELGHVRETQLRGFVRRRVDPKIAKLNKRIKQLEILVMSKNKNQ